MFQFLVGNYNYVLIMSFLIFLLQGISSPVTTPLLLVLKPRARVESTRKPVWREIHDARCPPFIPTCCKNDVITSFGCCSFCICSIIYQQIVILVGVESGEFKAQVVLTYVGRNAVKCSKCWEHSALFIVQYSKINV